MTDFEVKERRFEEDIEAAMLARGYLKGDPKAFNRNTALDEGTFLTFLRNSQPEAWAKLEKIYGAQCETKCINRFCRVTEKNGLLSVLRRGWDDRGVHLFPVFWKPETSLNEKAVVRYDANVFHCTRQLHYSSKNENSVDMMLFLNGIPVVSMELKCQFTGQDTSNAIRQYKFDRSGKAPVFRFRERVLVHFAVDLTRVYMTTRLEGAKTYFLPFNQGSCGAGRVGGAGNPVNPAGYATAYLWEDVLARDRLLELLQKYMHLQRTTDKAGRLISERMIFPRYHQLDVVTKLLADVKAHGAGRNYLIQHSAGSGKSNSIAWLAHRLAGLHDENNEKIFQSVIIVTDRRVLDSQLQQTVDQFDHVAGVVQKIDRNAQQLREAIEAGAGIIITTLQKFPVIYQQVRSGNRRFAIIVDEAHSSQTGEAAKKLKIALADTEAALEEYVRREGDAELARGDAEDRLLRELAAQGQHDNLSFFAFTATPKEKTLQLFGTRSDDGSYHPFHIYSMRQAIEEHFILDVLQNYMTYRMYYHIAKKIPDDPTLDTAAGLAAVRRFETLHPHNISQKTAVMLDHFLHVTRTKISGRAKAMVVTPSRLHAVRYFREFCRQLEERGISDVQVFAAFSGEVYDGGETYTEELLNRTADGKPIREEALPSVFHEEGSGILIVAEKYQTGFDEPLLHSMYVDKKLSGVKAVQTLSRLNRTAPGKQDTFVLDFVNTAGDIQKAFAPYYEETTLDEETDPNVVYDLRQTLEGYGVIRSEDEVYQFVELFFHKEVQQPGDLGRLQGYLQPAIDRYAALPKEKQDEFKAALFRFNRIYAFITQVCRLFDKNLHGFSVYTRFLAKMLPKDTAERLDLSDQIMLEYYRLEKEFEGSVPLQSSEGGTHPIKGDAGRAKEKKQDPLTAIINEINERYGTNFTEMDKVLSQLVGDYTSKKEWQNCARDNDLKTFLSIFKSSFESVALDRYSQDKEFFGKLFATPEMMEQIRENVGKVVYDEIHNKR